MFKNFIRILSLVLIVSLLWNMLPLSVLGEEFRATQSENNESISTETDATLETQEPEEITILGELTDRRTENIKEYLLSNGNTLAAVYGNSVHYQEDGQWKEIDNTLIAKDGTYVNTAGLLSVSFPQSLTGNNYITVSKDGYTLSFGMAGQLRDNNELIAYGAVSRALTQPEVEISVSAAKNALAQLHTVDFTEAKTAAKYPELVQEKLSSRLSYSNVYDNTNITYDLDSNRVKESVILSRYDATLRGYRYTLQTGDMIPVLAADGHIEFYDARGEEIILTMPAPFLVDADLVYNWDIEVSLTGGNGTYTLTYLLPQSWLAAEDRAWPIVLDPVVEVNNNYQYVADQTVFSQTTKPYTWGILQCGYGTEQGISRFYLKFSQLPTLGSADFVVDAQVTLRKAVNSTYPFYVGVHKANASWSSSGITWSNKPSFDANATDFIMVKDAGAYSWDVTDLARQWYQTGTNYGMVFRASDSVEQNSTANHWSQFYSSDYGAYEPEMTIEYRNTAGLEDYWDYTSASAGRAGTAYVNPLSGNLVWVHNDIGFDGNRMPVSISHIYNADDAWNIKTGAGVNAFGMGYGWRTNFNQTITAATEIDGTTYYTWEDGDGTAHEFYANASGVFKDIDDLGLTLTVISGSTTKYKITDKYDNTSEFDASGRLIKQSNNQATKSSITISYLNTTGNVIDKIVDGAGRTYKFTYNSSNLLTQIAYYGTYAVGTRTPFSVISFAYTSTKLTKITYADGAYSSFGYTTKNMLSTATDVDGYKITIGYDTLGTTRPSRVVSITESDNNKTGAVTEIAYYYQHTRLTDHNGNTTTFFFDKRGNTTSIQDSEGKAVFYQYDTDINTTGSQNRLISASQQQGTTINLLEDTSFENGTVWPGYLSGTISCSATTAYAHEGNYSLKSYCSNANNTIGAYYGTFTVAVGENYTFSAYIKTVGGQAKLRIKDDTGAYVDSATLPSNTDWTRLEASYTNKSTGARTITVCVYHLTPGTAYIDCVQLEKNPIATRYNAIDDSDILSSITSTNSPWNIYSSESTSAPTTAQKTPAPPLTGNVIQISGNHLARQYVYQTVTLPGLAGDRYVFSGWVKGAPLPENGSDRFCGLALVFNNRDGTKTEFKISANPNLISADQWQYLAAAAVANKSYNSIIIRAEFSYNTNTAYFDGLQLYQEEFGESYTYDANGNVTAVRDVLGHTTTYEYNEDNDVIKTVAPNGVTTTYDVSHHNVTGSLERYYNSDGSFTNLASYIYYYNSYGNLYRQSATMGDFVKITSATYSSDQNHLVSTVDELDNRTTYHYNPDTSVLEWVRYPNDTDATRTNYTYDAMYRLIGTSTTTDQGEEMSTDYTYTNDLLTQIETPSTTYSFAYGDFALRTSASIGSRTLATYTYSDDENKYLETLAFGNSDKVKYTYDNLGRVTQEAYYENGATTASRTITYQYDNMGALATVVDSKTGVTTKYYYDTVGRNIGMQESGGNSSHSLAYTYDELGRLQASKETVGSTDYTTAYTYNGSGQIKQITAGNSREEYIYDAYKRIDYWQTYHGNSSSHLIYKNIAFEEPDERSTSERISVLNYVSTGSFGLNYNFFYDGNGNIVRVTQTGGKNTYYHYDSANQLIREDNQAAGKTWVWVYDDAGNILSKKEYAYTTGTPGSATSTITYGYGNAEWGDLLTSYNGKSFSYDNIGNLLSDGTWNYTWAQGRQLATMSKSGTTWTFTYDANGMRTKRTTGSTSTTYNYTYNGSQLTHMTYGSNSLHFYYDASGKPLSVVYNGTTYYYILSLQGDVVAILNSSGVSVVEYTYDAWGRLLTTTGSMASSLGLHNPLRYRGYVYDQETGLYYLQSRYYNPTIGRFISADAFVSTGQGILGHNMFAYCNNNPVMFSDPAGESITIATLILIGSIVAAVGAAGYTAYVEYSAGIETGQIITDSLLVGMSTFMTVYTFGMSAYQCYLHFCYLQGLTPVTQIGGSGNVTAQLQACADAANAQVSGTGAVAGTHKHTAFAAEVNKLGNPSLRTEVSFLNGEIRKYGTKGSIRFDVVLFNGDTPIAAWDFKTGAAILTEARISQMVKQSGLPIPIYMIK